MPGPVAEYVARVQIITEDARLQRESDRMYDEIHACGFAQAVWVDPDGHEGGGVESGTVIAISENFVAVHCDGAPYAHMMYREPDEDQPFLKPRQRCSVDFEKAAVTRSEQSQQITVGGGIEF